MKVVLLFIVLIGTGAGLLALLFIVTFGFKKVRKIEEIVGRNGGSIGDQKDVWGSGPVGRWIRAVILMNFFFWRQFSGHGVKVASKLGDTSLQVPWALRAWLILPMTVFWIGFAALMLGGSVLVNLS